MSNRFRSKNEVSEKSEEGEYGEVLENGLKQPAFSRPGGGGIFNLADFSSEAVFDTGAQLRRRLQIMAVRRMPPRR